MNGTTVKSRLAPLRPWLIPLAAALVLLGEHIWRAEPARPYLSIAGALAILTALLWNTALARALRRESGAEAGHSGLNWPPALFTAAGLFYGVALWVPAAGTGPDWPAILGWAWMLCAVAGVMLHVFVEIAWLAQSGAARPEGQRLGRARDAGLSLALLLLLVIALNFVFDRLDWQWDLGYFHTALPSATTVETVRNLDGPVEVTVFFPRGNPVLALVEDYFAPLAGLSAHFQVSYYDAELNPGKARERKARRNGAIIVSREAVQREVSLGLTIDAAGTKLVKLDTNFLQKLAEVARPRRMAYLTVGHGERNEKDASLATGSRVKGLESILRAQNFIVQPLGLVSGLGTDIPEDATLVMSVGPEFPFRPEEEAALQRYLDRGGRLMLFLEPDAGTTPGVALPVTQGERPLTGLLGHAGVEFVAEVQANDRIYGRRTQTKADFALLATNRYQSHATVNSLRRNSSQFPLLFLGAGAFTKSAAPEPKDGKTDRPGALVVHETIKGMPGTWSDANRNFAFDEPREKRGEPALAVALAPKAAPKPKEGEPAPPPEPRLLAFADVDVASDLFIQNRANQFALLDGIAWLAGDAAPGAAPTEEEDLKIQHLKGDELVWFYLPVFGVPALVLLLGFWIARRTGALARRGGHA